MLLPHQNNMEEILVDETSHRGAVDTANDNDGGNMNSDDESSKEIDPVLDIIDYLVHNDEICFKSQQIGETNLRIKEKKQIAQNVYDKGKTLFLTKFGKYLTSQQLTFIENVKNDKPQDDYELTFLINQLKTMLSEKTRKMIVKNRRFEALQEMKNDNSDSYFSETEMMQRNPLLYEQLIGQYLSEEEKRDRDNIDTVNITLLNVLIEGIDRDRVKTVLKEQRAEEDCQMEENSSDEEAPCDEDNEDNEASSSKWGEFNVSEEKKFSIKVKPKEKKEQYVTATERELLREEFVQEMYRSFLAGEDEGFNYFPIDNSADYDCVELRARDEEEKYFDSESPIEATPDEVAEEEVSVDKQPIIMEQVDKKSESDDELDVFMVHLNRHPAIGHLVQK